MWGRPSSYTQHFVNFRRFLSAVIVCCLQTADIRAVRRPDRKGLLSYLNGESCKCHFGVSVTSLICSAVAISQLCDDFFCFCPFAATSANIDRSAPIEKGLQTQGKVTPSVENKVA